MTVLRSQILDRSIPFPLNDAQWSAFNNHSAKRYIYTNYYGISPLDGNKNPIGISIAN